MAAAPAAPAPSAYQLHVPRIIGLVGTLAVLAWANRETRSPILPAVAGLLVLYAALTNIDRTTALIRSLNDSLAGLFLPRAQTGTDTGRPTGSHRI